MKNLRFAVSFVLSFATILSSQVFAQAPSPPTIVKAFGATNVVQNSTVGVSFTLSNLDSVTLNGLSFTDALPAGLVVATPSAATTDCGGTLTAVSGSSSISFTGGVLDPAGPAPQSVRAAMPASSTPAAAAQGNCVIIVSLLVTGTGTISNVTGPVSATESGPGNPSNTATLEVVQTPTVNKAFGAASIPLNGTTSLTFNLANPNNLTPLVNISLNDALPAGLVVANPNGLTGSCISSSSIAANVGGSSINLTDLNLAPSASCSFSVNVRGTTAGTKNNATGNISATFDDGGGTFIPITGGTASASLFVVAPPAISNTFVPAQIAPNGTSALSFTISNPSANTVAEAGVAFTDTLPAGVVVATPNGLSSSCGGTATATAGSNSISLTGGSIAVAGSCTISINVTSAAAGIYTNFSGAVSSTNGGTGTISNPTTLAVANAASIAQSFNPAQIAANGNSTLTFNIANPNSLPFSGVAFTDNLPAGLVVASSPNLSNTCGGTATAAAGTVSLSAGTIASNASCTVSVNVQGTTAGVKNNSVQVTSNEGGAGNTANASLTVVAPPAIAAAFNPSTIAVAGTATLTLAIANPLANTVAADGVAFTDNLPSNLVVATPSGQTSNCGGTVTAVAGTGTVSLTGGTLAAAGGNCTITVNVTSAVAGNYTNATGAVSSTNGGTGNTASASLSVDKLTIAPTTLPDGTVTVAYAQSIAASGGTAPYAFSLSGGALPAGLTLGSNGNLSGTPTAVATSNFTVTATDSHSLTVSQAYTLTIGKKSTSISVIATPNPVIVGKPVTLTATVTGDPPTGSVSFSDNRTTLPCSPATLVPGASNSTAVCTATLAGDGSHSIVATYSGDSNFAPATSSTLIVTVNTPPVAAPMLDRWALLLLGTLLGAGVFWRGRRSWR